MKTTSLFITAGIVGVVLLTGCSDPRSQEYFQQSVNKKERNYVLQTCREKKGNLSEKETKECENAEAARTAEHEKNK